MTPASRAEHQPAAGRSPRHRRLVAVGVRCPGALCRLAGADARRRSPRGARGVARSGVANRAVDHARDRRRRLIGVALAWLLTRTDVPMAPLWRVLAPLPLVIPSFIGAAAFIAGLGPDGILRHALEFVGYHPPRRFRGLGASVLVLTLFTYPLVYLPVAARLAALPPQLEESSRLLGDRPAVHVPPSGPAPRPRRDRRRDAARVAVLPQRVRCRSAARLRHADPRRLRHASGRSGSLVHGGGDPRRDGAHRHRCRAPPPRTSRPAHRSRDAAQPGRPARPLEGAGGGVSWPCCWRSRWSCPWCRSASGRGGQSPMPMGRASRRSATNSSRWPRRPGRRRGSGSSPASSPSPSSFRSPCWQCAIALASPPASRRRSPPGSPCPASSSPSAWRSGRCVRPGCRRCTRRCRC